MLSFDQFIPKIKSIKEQPVKQINPTISTYPVQTKPAGYKSINSSSMIIGSK